MLKVLFQNHAGYHLPWNCFLKHSVIVCQFSSLCIDSTEDKPLKGTRENEWNQKQLNKILAQLDHHGFKADSCLYAALLRYCGNAKSLPDGKRVHAHISTSGQIRNLYLRNLLLQMYAKCGAVQDANDLFAKIKNPDIFSWTFVIAANVHQHGHAQKGLQLYQQMQQESELPNCHTFVSVLSLCAKNRLISDGRSLHASVTAGRNDEVDIAVVTSLITMYGKCGFLLDGINLFNDVLSRSSVIWNSLISAFSECDHIEGILGHFNQMQQEGWIPTRVTFLKIISVCWNLSNLRFGKQIHTAVVGSELSSDIALGNCLISMYSHCCSFKNACEVFDMMPDRDIASWNTVIGGLGRINDVTGVLQFLCQVHQECKMFNELTYIVVLSTFKTTSALKKGKEMHTQLEGVEFVSSISVGTSLITMYSCCCTDMESAQLIFDSMEQHNTVCWNALITGYVRKGNNKEAYYLFRAMQAEGFIPDRITFSIILEVHSNRMELLDGQLVHYQAVITGTDDDVMLHTALIDMYGKCGSIDSACWVFNTMACPNVVSWTARIAAHACNNEGCKAWLVFQRMKLSGVIPDTIAFVSILDALSVEESLAKGKQVHTHIFSSGFEFDVVVANSLMNMYVKCGSFEDSLKVFNKIQNQSLISWTALITSCAQKGLAKEALEMSLRMRSQGMIPDNAALWTILTACSYGGLLAEWIECWIALSDELNCVVSIDYCNSLIDLLGRIGRLYEVEGLINEMPLQPNSTSWLTFLGACRIHADAERGKRAAVNVFTLDPDDTAPYILLLNIHSFCEGD